MNGIQDIGLWLKALILASIICNITSANSDYFVGDFDSQLQHVLTSQMLKTEEITNLSAVFQDLQKSLGIKWPGSEVIPIGSLTTGLAIKSSDADCMIKVPDYTVYNVTANHYLITQAVRVLRREPHLYANVRAKHRARNKISLLRFTYVPTQKNCDVNFISTHGLEISQMIACYYKTDERALKIAAAIKYWTKIHRLNKHDMLTSYTLNLLIIFYFQQINLLPPYHLVQNLDCRKPLENWKIFANNSSSITLYELLGGFFEYYSEFNFDEYVISPFFGRPIHKRQFWDIESLPDELYMYKKYMRQAGSKPFALNRRLCVQDLFMPYLNTEEFLRPISVVAFLTHVKYAAALFVSTSSDRFLYSILDRNQYDVILDP